MNSGKIEKILESILKELKSLNSKVYKIEDILSREEIKE